MPVSTKPAENATLAVGLLATVAQAISKHFFHVSLTPDALQYAPLIVAAVPHAVTSLVDWNRTRKAKDAAAAAIAVAEAQAAEAKAQAEEKAKFEAAVAEAVKALQEGISKAAGQAPVVVAPVVVHTPAETSTTTGVIV